MSTDPRPNIWIRFQELRRVVCAEGFWDQENSVVVPAITEFSSIMGRLGGVEALDDPRGWPPEWERQP